MFPFPFISPYVPPPSTPFGIRAAGIYASGIGDVTPALPTYSEMDILVLVVESAYGQPASAPSGWTLKQQGSVSEGSTPHNWAVFWKRASASESAPTVTDTGDHTIAQIFSVGGVKTSGDPFHRFNNFTTSGSWEDPNRTVITTTQVITTVDGCVVVAGFFGGADYSGSLCSDWDGWSELLDRHTSSGGGGGFGFAYKTVTTAGNSGTTTPIIGNDDFPYDSGGGDTVSLVTMAFAPA